MTKVSIILPIYNVAQYLPRCIDSVLNQTLRDIEIILATDGPADCDTICSEYARKDDRIKIIFHPGSYGKAVNQGIRIARGEYIGIVETDDWCDLRMFEKLYHTAKEFGADVAKSGFYGVKKNRIKKKVFTSKKRLLTPDQDIHFFDFVPSLWCAIYKTSFLRENHIVFPEERISYIDTPFVLETFVKSQKFVYLPEALYFYNCINPESSSKSSEKIFDGIKAEEFFYNRIDTKIFNRIKKAYLIGLATRLKWNLDRIEKDKDKQLFWEAAHKYIQSIGVSTEDLSLFSDEALKQLLLLAIQTDKYEDYKSASHFKSEFKLGGFPVLKKETMVGTKTIFYLFDILPLLSIKFKKGKCIYKLFGFLPVYKRRKK